MPIFSPKTVFISYAHDDEAHARNVLVLADQLLADGIDVILDQYDPHPSQGWPDWMEAGLDRANVVLMVCSPAYFRRIKERQAAGKGLGVQWEGNLIYTRLYGNIAQADKYIPVLLQRFGVEDIPDPVRTFTRYQIATPDLSDAGYEGLYRHLTGQPATPKPDIGTVKALSARRDPRPGPPSGHSSPLGETSVALHNWTVDRLDPPADYVLDWSEHFKRYERETPAASTWDNILIPELRSTHDAILHNKKSRTIKLLGKSCLSAGIAFGLTFPENGGWVIEVQQPPSPSPWYSNAVPDLGYAIRVREVVRDPNGDSIALVLNIKGNAFKQVETDTDEKGISAKSIIAIEPASTAGSLSIADDCEAVSYATAVRDTLQRARNEHNVDITHLYYYGPISLAVFLGQRLTALGAIQLYEFKDPGYVPSCKLRT